MMELEMAIREYMLGRPAIKIEREEEDFMGEIVDLPLYILIPDETGRMTT